MRLSTHLRLAFHDWMWDPKSKHPGIRRLCQRLPIYFTDPHLDGVPRDPDKFRVWLDGLEPTRGPRPPWVVVEPTMTASSGAPITVRWNY